MKKLSCCALLFTLAFASQTMSAESARPNIVLIISDDQAWTDYGFMGHPEIKTPHLDELAKRSKLFKRGYVSSPLCRPSLASIVTGLYPLSHGVTGNDVDGYKNRAALDAPLRELFYKQPNIVQLLVKHGYLAHQSGKWWEGSYADGGFTHGMTHGDPKRGGRHGDAGLKIGREGLEPISEFIDVAQKEEKPFFLWYAPFLPHTPHNPPQRLLDKYTKPDRADDVAKYYAMCEWFDETCGELMGILDTKGVRDNTMVLYVCDNGWVPTSENADDPNQKAWKAYALKSKTTPYENGIRTPIMVSWPSHVEPESVDDFACSVDFVPTIAAATGIEPPANLPGIDLLEQRLCDQREQVFGVCNSTHNMTIGDPNDTLQYLWVIEDEWKLLQRFDGKDTTKYKLVHAWDTAPVHLYKIKEDPHETTDVASEYPAVVERLKKAIKEWRNNTASQGKLAALPKPDEKLLYKTTAEGKLHLHVFNPKGHKATDNKPAIVFFFGGGWVGGTPAQFYLQCRHLADRGMVAVAAEYRVKNRHGTPPSACVEDGKSAVRWIRSHAKELGINPDMLAAGGGSAGGHVAAACGSVEGFNDEADDTSISARPDALVLYNPVYDNGPKGYGHKRVQEYWQEISPFHNITKQTPPTIVFLGDEDSLIPVDTAEQYQQRMRAHGVRSDLHVYTGQPHGFFNRSRGPNYFAVTTYEMDRFLTSLKFLKALE